MSVGASSATLPLGTLAPGTTGGITFPAATSGSGTITALYGTTLPGLAPVLSSSQRLAAKIGVTPLSGIVYVSLTATANITLPHYPAFTFTLSGGTQQTLASLSYLALYDGSKATLGWTAVDGPGVVNGSTVSFTGGAQPFTMTAGQIYVFAYFTAQQAVTIPSAQPSASPSPAPTATTLVVPVGQSAANVGLGSISSGISATMAVPAITTGTGSLTVQLGATRPGLAPVLSSVSRAPAAVGAPSMTGLAYVTLTPTTNLTLPSFPGYVFTFAAGTPAALTGQAYMALYDASKPVAGWTLVDGPGIINGSNVTFTGGPASFSMTAGQLYVMSFFTVPSVLALPYSVLANGAAVATVTLPNSTSTTVNVTLPGGSNPAFAWTTNNCTGLVTTPASGTGPSFTLVSPGTTIGSCTFSVGAGTGSTPATVNVTVN